MTWAPATMLDHGTQVLKSLWAVEARQSRPPSLVKDNDTGRMQTSRSYQFLCLGVSIGTLYHVCAVLWHGIGGVGG